MKRFHVGNNVHLGVIYIEYLFKRFYPLCCLRMDEALKQKATELFAKAGLGYEEAIETFVRNCVEAEAVPFRADGGPSLTDDAAIIALADRYFRIYYVNTQTDEFIRIDYEPNTRKVLRRQMGMDFFRAFHDRGMSHIHPNDRETLFHALQKETLLKNLKESSVVTVSHRAYEEGTLAYQTLRAATLRGHFIVLGIANSDEQHRIETDLRRRVRKAKAQAQTDGLTGLYNQRAYELDRAKLRARIEAGKAEPFAVVVCDLNNLKLINDTQGHMAGDDYIKAGAARIRSTFDPCRIYRIGGDEFVAILTKRAYENRDYLVSHLIDQSYKARQKDEAVIAVGMAVYDPALDRDFSSVFVRADMEMYDNKHRLKSI